MKFTVQDVEHVASLARIALSEEEKKKYAGSLNNILENLAVLNQVDTTQVEPTTYILPLQNVFREDREEPCLEKEIVFKNAPEEENGCFKVPRIL
ncbi:MAG: Asp-tRNA(Asn)/Glu-tRNA(Gln) amidotransferase subunit GatC [Peptococcia bacterium]|jgi:aspartyl-tRNA(Asn)/glutamyl-tRNA(Gln) amidotransferase subunit C